MKERWIGRDVDLNLLSQRIQRFLEAKNFLTRLDKPGENEIEIFAMPSDRGEGKVVAIKVYGGSNDFAVEFVGGQDSRTLRLFGPILTFFGGGFLLLPHLKLREFFEKLEGEFWPFLEESVIGLTGSARLQ